MSNNERQREFRLRNPGYYRRYNGRVDREAIRQQVVALLAEHAARAAEPPAAPAPLPPAEPPADCWQAMM